MGSAEGAFHVATHFGEWLAVFGTRAEADEWRVAASRLGNPAGLKKMPPPPGVVSARAGGASGLLAVDTAGGSDGGIALKVRSWLAGWPVVGGGGCAPARVEGGLSLRVPSGAHAPRRADGGVRRGESLSQKGRSAPLACGDATSDTGPGGAETDARTPG